MHALGIRKVHDRLQWALLRKGKGIEIVRLEEGISIPDEVLSIKNLMIVTGLEGSSVLRRDLKLPLKSERTIKEALPFQLEPLFPFPMDQCIVFPEMHPAEKETFIVAWAATLDTVKSHIDKWSLNRIDPDLVSSETLALARWARYAFPEESELALVHETLGIALDQNRVVCAMESPDPDRLKLFLKQKYPLYTWKDDESDYAVAIGLALEAFQERPCQFRSNSFPSSRQERRERSFLKTVFYAGSALTLITAVISIGILHFQETKLKNQIALFYKGPEKSLELSLNHFREKVMKEIKTSPPVFNIPTAKEVLSWISTLSAPIEINHFEYEFREINKVRVSLEFQANAPSDADQFVKQLQQSPTFVESTSELKWTSLPQGYKLSFDLRKNS